jgi:hypothetical protein
MQHFMGDKIELFLMSQKRSIMLSSFYRRIWYLATSSASGNILSTAAGCRTHVNSILTDENKNHSLAISPKPTLETALSFIQWVRGNKAGGA